MVHRLKNYFPSLLPSLPLPRPLIGQPCHEHIFHHPSQCLSRLRLAFGFPYIKTFKQENRLTAGHANSEHAGATYEFRSNPTSNNHGNQCTYNSYGYIMTTIPAAGTADYKAFNYSAYDHFWHDLDTWWLAKYLNRKEDYYSVRPIVIEYSWF